MKVCLHLCCLLIITTHSYAAGIEDHILTGYGLLVDKLETNGIKRPFAEDVAKFALIRQIVEDGADRSHCRSIVGMSLCEPHSAVLQSLGLKLGKVGAEDIRLGTVRTADSAYYELKGPRANLCSAAAIALLWDKYVNELHVRRFNEDEREAWNVSKEISDRISHSQAALGDFHFYRELKPLRTKVLSKVNSIYSSTAAATINNMVMGFEHLFQCRKQ